MSTRFVDKHINAITGVVVFGVSSSFVLSLVFIMMTLIKINRKYVTAEITDSALSTDPQDNGSKVNLYTATFKLKKGKTQVIKMRQPINLYCGKIHPNGKFLMVFKNPEKISETLRFATGIDKVPSFILGSVFTSITFIAYMILTKKDAKF